MKKTIKINIVKAMALLLFVAVLGISQTVAQTQYYGGSAYVHVKDSKGNTRVLTVTISCDKTSASSESSVKSSMETLLNRERKRDEEFNSQIYYDIDRCTTGNSRYAGTASVRVRDSNGNTRVLTTTISCEKTSTFSRSSAQYSMEYNLKRARRTGEEFITGINYDISRCN